MSTNDIRVGCKRDARKALKGELAPVSSDPLDYDSYEGAFRRVYVSQDGSTVYKVGKFGEDWANRDEAEIARRCRTTDVGRKWVCPTTLWVIDGVGVVAQPRMSRIGSDYIRDLEEHGMLAEIDMLYKEIREVAKQLGVGDMHEYNWMVDDAGHIWFVDIQNGYGGLQGYLQNIGELPADDHERDLDTGERCLCSICFTAHE